MNQTPHIGTQENLLSPEEMKRFEGYRLPLFQCSSCGEYGNGSMVNIIGNACVNCGSTTHMDEFMESSEKQIKKEKYTTKVDISDREHQRIIKLMQTNVLWQCDQCERNNLNLPKDRKGNPDTSVQVQCQGCGHPYEHKKDILPLWTLKGYGFDDGNDHSDTYELKKLAELQTLFLRASRYARSLDSAEGGKEHANLFKLFENLERIKSQNRYIGTRRMGDGQKAINFLKEYLWVEYQEARDESSSYAHHFSRRADAILGDTPDMDLREKYQNEQEEKREFQRKKILLGIGVGSGSIAILLSALSMILEVPQTIHIQALEHQAKILREEKGKIQKTYTLSRREPYYSGGVRYKAIADSSGQSEFEEYRQESDLYQLELQGTPTEERNGITSLDTGKTRSVWVSQICPDTDTDFGGGGGFGGSGYGGGSSGGGGGGGFGGGGGSGYGGGSSTGRGFDGNGGIFYKPTPEEMFPGMHPDIVSFNHINTIITDTGNALVGLLVSPAYADSCGYWDEETIYEDAQRFMTVQHYSVWDWKTRSWIHSTFTSGTETQKTIDTLIEKNITDSNNQRVIDTHLILQMSIKDEEGIERSIEFTDYNQWKSFQSHLETDCTISTSYWRKWFGSVQDDDILESCHVK